MSTPIVVLVSGGGTNLQSLIDAQKSGRLGGGKIAAVISSKPDVFALERARQNGIPALVVSRKDYGSIADFSKALGDAAQRFSPKLIVYAGFLSILDDGFCRLFPHSINIHPSLIPAFCGKGMYGLKVHEAALSRGVKLSGATVHFVNEQPDGGPIILQKAVEVLPNDTAESLQARIMEQCERVLLPKAVELFCRGALSLSGGKVIIGQEQNQ